jgi:hypothetical protein
MRAPGLFSGDHEFAGPGAGFGKRAWDNWKMLGARASLEVFALVDRSFSPALLLLGVIAQDLGAFFGASGSREIIARSRDFER